MAKMSNSEELRMGQPRLSTADLTMFIYGLGILDMGEPETWVLLEQLLLDNF
jgi:hypothetical protein